MHQCGALCKLALTNMDGAPYCQAINAATMLVLTNLAKWWSAALTMLASTNLLGARDVLGRGSPPIPNYRRAAALLS